MHWNSLNLDALIQYGVLSLGMIAAMVLFLALKREISDLTQRNRRYIRELETRLLHVESQARERAETPEDPPAAFVPPPGSGFNLNHRVQALRLLRRGEDVGHVAAALGVPRAEVELLVRVQDLSSARLPSRS